MIYRFFIYDGCSRFFHISRCYRCSFTKAAPHGTFKVIAPTHALLVTTEHPRSVHETQGSQYWHLRDVALRGWMLHCLAPQRLWCIDCYCLKLSEAGKALWDTGGNGWLQIRIYIYMDIYIYGYIYMDIYIYGYIYILATGCEVQSWLEMGIFITNHV
jgi:hypothetical protein